MSSNSSYNPTVRHLYSFGSDSGSTKLQWYDWKEVWEKTEYHLVQWILHLSVNASLMILLKVLGSSQISPDSRLSWYWKRNMDRNQIMRHLYRLALWLLGSYESVSREGFSQQLVTTMAIFSAKGRLSHLWDKRSFYRVTPLWANEAWLCKSFFWNGIESKIF